MGIVLLLLAYWTFTHGGEVLPEELTRRCTEAQPSWANYDEDLKAQVGAAYVARWSGAPVHAEMRSDVLFIDFYLEPPWARYGCALPVLVREPAGRVLQSVAATHSDAMVTYRFNLPPDYEESCPPWVTVRYPRDEWRLPLGPEGVWTAP